MFIRNVPSSYHLSPSVVPAVAVRKLSAYAKEVGAGARDHRKPFLALLAEPTITVIVVEPKDRATRFGFNDLETLPGLQSRRSEVVQEADHGREDLLADLGAIIYSFCARLYGQRRAKHKTE